MASMSVTLREVLDLPSVRQAQPRLATGNANVDREVSWVHSSDIYEIAPLLAGGELLLTTGLGLAGVDAGARRHWIRELHARSIAAVAIEIGRSLPEVPQEVLDEARKLSFPLVVLEEVVPFALISKEVNALILDHESQALRIADRTTKAIHDALVAQSSLAGVVQMASSAANMPMVVVTATGRVVAASGDRVTPGPLPTLTSPGVVLGDIVTMGRHWGTLIVEPQEFHSAAVADAVTVRTASAVGVAVMQTSVATSDSESVATALLGDLLDGETTVREQDLLIRGGLAGFSPRPGHNVIGLSLDASDRSVVAAVNAAVGQYGGSALCGPILGTIGALVTAPRGVPDPASVVVEALTEAANNVGLQDPAGVVGPVVPLSHAGRSLRQSHERLALVRNPARLVDSRELSLLAALSAQSGDELASLVADVLGPIVEWDDRHSTDLVHTLHLYVRVGQSASNAARELHVRRQTIHQRMARIESLLNRSPNDKNMVETFVAATAAHRLIESLG